MAWHRIQYANGHVTFSVPGITEYAYCLFYFRACSTFQEVSEYFSFQSTKTVKFFKYAKSVYVDYTFSLMVEPKGHLLYTIIFSKYFPCSTL